jgi:predicted outer membrane repeat protein
LVDTDFTANTTDVGSGGGIYNASGKTLNLTGGNFYSNYADFAGGGIYNQGYLTLLGTMFFYNHAFNNDGGAIYSEKYADIEQATFSLNEAELDGGAFSNDGGDFVIKSSTFMGNTAGSKGGGVHVPDTHLTAKIRQSTFSYNYARSGAGIYNDTGDIDIYNSVFSHNDATVNDGGGGYNLNGTINIYSSTFESNSADGNGGGFYNNGILRIYYNLFSGNSAGDDGGGVWSDSSSGVLIVQNSTYYDNDAARGGAFYAMESVLLTNITVSGNRATTTGGGGGLYATSETLLKNSIIANSTSGGNCASGGFYPTNSGNNIDSGTTCGFGSANGSLSSTNPQLEALKDNGGATKTMALLPGSPAVNHVIWSAPNNCPDDDQREYPRPYGTYCDIGAFERYYRTFLPLAIK